MKSDYTPPKPTSGDVAHALARSGLGAIPFAGSAAIELLNGLVVPPLLRRQQEWMERVGKSLLSLEKIFGTNLESLKDSEDFLDIFIETTRIAIKTNKEFKLNALNNALLNCVLNTPLDDSIHYIYLSHIDAFTPWHMKLLKYLDSDYSPKNDIDTSTNVFIERDFTELLGRNEFYRLIGKDLYSRALINNANFISPPNNGLSRNTTTDLGKDFLRFVQNPKLV